MDKLLKKIALRSSVKVGARTPPRAIGEILTVVPDLIQSSVRMAFESRSHGKGKKPKWLSAASDVRFLGHDGSDDTILIFEAPSLGDAAPSLYQQREIWPTLPDSNLTGFDLLESALADVISQNAESDRFDRPLLRHISKVRKGLNGFYQRIDFLRDGNPCGNAYIDEEVANIADAMASNTPIPIQTRVSGRLDMIRSSTSTFAIKLSDGLEARGCLLEGRINDFKHFLDRNVVVFGRAVFRPSGQLLRIDAKEILLSDSSDDFFSSTPRPRPTGSHPPRSSREKFRQGGLAAVFGKWPGDETDEVIDSALKEIE